MIPEEGATLLRVLFFEGTFPKNKARHPTARIGTKSKAICSRELLFN